MSMVLLTDIAAQKVKSLLEQEGRVGLLTSHHLGVEVALDVPGPPVVDVVRSEPETDDLHPPRLRRTKHPS